MLKSKVLRKQMYRIEKVLVTLLGLFGAREIVPPSLRPCFSSHPLETFLDRNIARQQGCQMVANLANIVKNHCFPKNLPIFLAIFFNAKNLPFLK